MNDPENEGQEENEMTEEGTDATSNFGMFSDENRIDSNHDDESAGDDIGQDDTDHDQGQNNDEVEER